MISKEKITKQMIAKINEITKIDKIVTLPPHQIQGYQTWKIPIVAIKKCRK